jgi:Holliday junction resolvase-like predicted endonuclease
MDKRKNGNLGEDLACRYLAERGFTILTRNYLKPWGEIDIIAEKGGIVRFIEVKTISRVTGHSFSREMDHQPEELVDLRKLRKVGVSPARGTRKALDNIKEANIKWLRI